MIIREKRNFRGTLVGMASLTGLVLLTGCGESGGSITAFDQEYGQIIADGIRETMEAEKDGMFTSWVSKTKATTGLELDDYAVQCTAKIMAYAGEDVPDVTKTLMIEYKRESEVFENAPKMDAFGALQISDLVEGKIYHCLRAASIDCCGQQS